MPDDNTIRFTFRTLDTNLQKIKYIAGYNATSMNYEIDRQIKKYIHRHASDSQNVLGQTTVRTNEAVMNSLKHIAQLHGLQPPANSNTLWKNTYRNLKINMAKLI